MPYQCHNRKPGGGGGVWQSLIYANFKEILKKLQFQTSMSVFTSMYQHFPVVIIKANCSKITIQQSYFCQQLSLQPGKMTTFPVIHGFCSMTLSQRCFNSKKNSHEACLAIFTVQILQQTLDKSSEFKNMYSSDNFIQ